MAVTKGSFCFLRKVGSPVPSFPGEQAWHCRILNWVNTISLITEVDNVSLIEVNTVFIIEIDISVLIEVVVNTVGS